MEQTIFILSWRLQCLPTSLVLAFTYWTISHFYKIRNLRLEKKKIQNQSKILEYLEMLFSLKEKKMMSKTTHSFVIVASTNYSRKINKNDCMCFRKNKKNKFRKSW